MLRILLFHLGLFLLLTSCKPSERSLAQKEVPQKPMKSSQNWQYDCFLEISEQDHLEFQITYNDELELLQVINGKEKIDIQDYLLKEDTIAFTLPVFYSQIEANLVKGQLIGKWNKYPETDREYHMALVGFDKNLQAIPEKFARTSWKKKTDALGRADITGKWATTFSPNTDDAYAAIGEFQQNGNKLSGTFLTETGDYRFLQGFITGKHFELSTFDGSHAFLFKGEVTAKQKIKGTFFSGTHWKEPFEAVFNPEASLGDPYKLTYLKDPNERFDFSFEDIATGDSLSFNDPDLDGKVVMLQIFGSWCPNCMDETELYADLYKKYRSQGLEIIGIAFERAERLDEKTKILLEKYRKHFDMDYRILFGGKANKKLAGEKFPMLNHIMSFPTTIIIDKNKKIREIHTGFNGPATTGYSDFVKDLENKIENLLAD